MNFMQWCRKNVPRHFICHRRPLHYKQKVDLPSAVSWRAMDCMIKLQQTRSDSPRHVLCMWPFSRGVISRISDWCALSKRPLLRLFSVSVQVGPRAENATACYRDPRSTERQHNTMRCRTVTHLIRKHFYQGCQNGAFGKRSFCSGDTWHPPFSSFSSISGAWGAKSLVFVDGMHYQNFADFRQNHLFSAGDKTTVFQNDRFDDPDFNRHL